MMRTIRRGSPVITLVISCLGTFLVLLDASSISVVLPTIQINFHTSLPDLQWVVDAYTLPFALFLLPANALGDRFGRKRLLLSGLGLFLLGSLGCGLAPTFGWVLAGRVVQGIGVAALASGSFSSLLVAFPTAQARARALAIWGAGSGLALPVGTFLGGLLIQVWSWPAIFFMNLPIGLLALALAWPLLGESRALAARRLDFVGFLLMAGWLTCIIVATIASSSQGWTSPLILSLLISAALLFGVFILVETKVREPLVPLRLLRKRVFSLAQFGGLVHGFAAIGTIFFFTQYFQEIQGYSAFEASVRTLPISAGAFLIAPVAARLAATRLGPRLPIALGAGFGAVALLLLTRLAPETSYTVLWWQLGLLGFGVGLMLGPLNMALLSATPETQTGSGASMMNTSRQMGAALGVAVLGTLACQQFAPYAIAQFAQQDLAQPLGALITGQVAHAGAFASQVPLVGPQVLSQAALHQTLNQAFVDSLHSAFLVAGVGLLIVAVLVACLLYQKQDRAHEHTEVAEVVDTQERAIAHVK